jgi:hypothetical protein
VTPPLDDSNNTSKILGMNIVTHSALKDGEFALVQTPPNTGNGLDEILDAHLNEIKAGHDSKLKSKLTKYIKQENEKSYWRGYNKSTKELTDKYSVEVMNKLRPKLILCQICREKQDELRSI